MLSRASPLPHRQASIVCLFFAQVLRIFGLLNFNAIGRRLRRNHYPYSQSHTLNGRWGRGTLRAASVPEKRLRPIHAGEPGQLPSMST